MISDNCQDPIADDARAIVSNGMGGKRKSAKRKRERDELAVRAGKCLRLARKARKLSQAALGKIIGVGQPAVVAYEKGDHLMDLGQANRLQDITGIDLYWIYRGDPTRLPGDILAKLPENWREIVFGPE